MNFEVVKFKNTSRAVLVAILLPFVFMVAEGVVLIRSSLMQYHALENDHLLADVLARGGSIAANEILAAIEAADIVLPSGELLRVTASFGCAGRANAASNRNFDDLVKRADLALYAAKASGRNCVVASPIVPASVLQEERRKAAGGTHDFRI